MPVPTLIIGLGGTGLKALLMIKERLIEAYGGVPQEVRLLELDTDNYPDDERRSAFNGVRLTLEGDKKWNPGTQQFEAIPDHEVEFYHIQTNNQNQLLTPEMLNKPGPEWSFIDAVRINRTITSAEDRIISKGARTIRPLSKIALYLDYPNTINKIHQHTNWLNQIEANPSADNKTAKGRIFVLGSAAGGSGAGLVVDILKILGDLCSGSKALPTSCLLAGGQNFAREADLSRTFSNTFAVLREVERLGAMSKLYLPSRIPAKFYTPAKSIVNEFEPASEVIVFDYPDRLSRERVNLGGGGSYLDQVVVPAMADYVTVLIDKDVSAQMSSFKADFSQVFPLEVEHQREYTYFGVGIHSLIFPERDVRKTAGFKLLGEIWADCLVRDERLEQRDPSGSELEEPTKSIVEKHKKIATQKLIPYIVTQIGFQSSTVVGDVINNAFIKLVATSSIKGNIQVPKTFWDFFLQRSILERIFNLIGAPSKAGEVTDDTMAQLSENFAKVFDDTIENYLAQRTTRKEVDDWRRIYWGPGGLGAEDMDKGEWMNIIRSDSYIQGHKNEFMSVLGQVVKVILNDKGPDGIMPYRLEYAHRVLDELERLTRRWIQADEKKNASLLSEAEWFKRDHAKFQERIKRASKATDENEYKRQVEAAAKIRRNLVAYYLFEELCKLLLDSINNWQKELSGWRTHFRDALAVIQKEESKHSENRAMKKKIKVRAYVTKDGFENRLYQQHKAAALASFRQKVKWTYEIGEESHQIYDLASSKNNLLTKQVPVIWLEDSVFAKSILDNPRWDQEYRKELQDKLRLTAVELAARSIKWACTDKGNENRPDVGAAFSALGGVDEVKMGDQICDYYGTGEGTAVGELLTNEQVISTICPLNNWPYEKMIYMSYIPMHDIKNNNDQKKSFYSAIDTQLKNRAGRYKNNRSYTLNTASENPRHAYGMEMSVLWQLKDLMSYEKYANSYSNDDRKNQALHCLPEEKLAAQVYEVAINYQPQNEKDPSNELFEGLGINPPIRLVPEIVDLLSSRDRLESFAKAFACHLIHYKYEDGDSLVDLTDWYVYPGNDRTRRYRISMMQNNTEIDSVLSDLIPDNNRIAAIRGNSEANKVILNRVRFWYALRTFMLYEKDLDDNNRKLPYQKLEADAELFLDGKNRDEVYDAAIAIFRKWYLDYKDAGGNLIVLAHLGLLMMAVANDLKMVRH